MYRIERKWRALVLAAVVSLAAACSRDPDVAKREYLASGNQFASEGKVRESIVQYRNAIKQDPRFGEARFQLADAYVKNGDLNRASQEYIRAADLMPKNVDAQLKAGRVLLMATRFEDAKTRAHNALALDRKNVEAQILLGNALAGLKDLEGAVEEIQEAIQLDPTSTTGYVSLGALEQAAGRKEAAEAAFNKAVESDPKSIPARLALANYYWAARKPAETSQVLQEALVIDPEHILLNRMMALFQIASGKPAAAEPYFTKIASLSKDGNAKLFLADYYIAAGRSKEAAPILQQLTANKQALTPAALRLAEIEIREGRRDEAQKRISEILKREPNNASAIVLQGSLLSAEGELDEAISKLQSAVSADQTSAQAHFALGRAHLAKGDREQAAKSFNETLRLNPRAVAAQLELSRLELASGRADASVQFAQQALKHAPTNPDVRLALVRGLIAKRDVRRADVELQALVKEHPHNAAVQTQMAIVSAMKGDRPGATRLLARALEIDANNIEALSTLVSLDLAQKDNASAVARVEQRLARTPNDAGALMLAATTYGRAGDLKKAETALRKTVEVDPSNFDAYTMLARLYLSQERLDESLAEFDRLAKRQARPVQAHTLAGIILEAQNKPQEARKRYELALALDPEMPVAANNLAWMYAESGENLDVALQLAQAAARRLPENAAVQDTLGWIYYKKGLATLAIPAFAKSIEKDPKNAIYHFHLGLAQAKAGDSLKARASLRQALTLAPNFNGASEAKQVLASIKG